MKFTLVNQKHRKYKLDIYSLHTAAEVFQLHAKCYILDTLDTRHSQMSKTQETAFVGKQADVSF